MIDIIVAMLFQAAQETAPAPQPAQPAATEENAPPKLVCKREFELGSRVKKIKVCRSADDPVSQDEKTKLQRSLSKMGDVPPPRGGLGN